MNPLTPVEERTRADIPGSGRNGSLQARLRELVEGFLVEDRVEIRLGDPVGGGGPACCLPGCPRPASTKQLCKAHLERWNWVGRPDLAQWDPGDPPEPEWLSLARLPVPLRFEVAYGLLRARQTRAVDPIGIAAARRLLDTLATTEMSSLFDRGEHEWPTTRSGERIVKLRIGFITFTIDEIDRLQGICTGEYEYARDVWRLRRLGFTGTPEGWQLDFRRIDQPWLREAVKKFLRWRHDTGHSASGMHRDVLTLTRLGHALTECAGPAAAPEQFDRAVITRLLALFVADGFTANGRRQRMSSVKRFFAIARQHDWLPGVPARTAVYSEDFPAQTQLAPRALSAFVTAQLKNPGTLDKLTDPRWRLLFPLLMETGLRLNDALHLPTDCVVHDQRQAPYLRFHNRKMKIVLVGQ
ncbi:hypothetical protein [Nocardia sp. NPDC047648]|uniref:hypothetical protein n=1 Tax=Nocardia sp. NPDC047648 TaxID=3155625 RepID=UPI0033E488B8